MRTRTFARLGGGLFAFMLAIAGAPSPATAADTILTVNRSGSAGLVNLFLSQGDRLLRVQGCTGGGCGECVDEVCSWAVPAGTAVTLTARSLIGFVEKIDAPCVGGLKRETPVPGLDQASCTFSTARGPMTVGVVVNRPQIRLSVEGPTVASVLNPQRPTDPIVLTVRQGSGMVEVDRGTVVSFRQEVAPGAPDRVVLMGFSGDCVSAEAWCNVAVDKPQVAVTARAVHRPLIP